MLHYNSTIHYIVTAPLHYSGPLYMYCFVPITCTGNTCENSIILNSCSLFTISHSNISICVQFYCSLSLHHYVFSMVNVPLNCSVLFHFSVLFQRVTTVRRAFRQQLSDAIARVAVLYNVRPSRIKIFH